MTFCTLLIVYIVGWLSGLCSVLFWDLLQYFKRN